MYKVWPRDSYRRLPPWCPLGMSPPPPGGRHVAPWRQHPGRPVSMLTSGGTHLDNHLEIDADVALCGQLRKIADQVIGPVRGAAALHVPPTHPSSHPPTLAHIVGWPHYRHQRPCHFQHRYFSTSFVKISLQSVLLVIEGFLSVQFTCPALQPTLLTSVHSERWSPGVSNITHRHPPDGQSQYVYWLVRLGVCVTWPPVNFWLEDLNSFVHLAP